jgi:recombination protein RecT
MTTENNKPTVSLQGYIRSGKVQEVIEQSLGGKNAGAFTTSLLSVVNTNPVLQDCPPESIIKAAITASALSLPIDPNLGFAYIIPYNNKVKTKETVTKADGSTFERTIERWQMTAQFQLGYKGFIQLAQRSGQFKRINATDVREGEYLGIDRRSGELNIEWEQDEAVRNKKKVVGYLGYFRLLNGFEKELYMSVDELTNHAKKYSKSFAKGYGLWKDQFDVMAKKTVLKLLISKYGALSTTLQEAILADQAAVEEDGYKYVDNDKDIVDSSDESANKGKSDKENVIDGDVVEDDVDQTPKEPTEAEAPQAEPVAGDPPKKEAKASAPVETPKEKLQRKIAESAERRKAEAEKGTQSTLIDEAK